MVDYKLVETEPTPPPPEVHLIMSRAEAIELRKLIFWAYQKNNGNASVGAAMASALDGGGVAHDVYEAIHEATTGRKGHLA